MEHCVGDNTTSKPTVILVAKPHFSIDTHTLRVLGEDPSQLLEVGDRLRIPGVVKLFKGDSIPVLHAPIGERQNDDLTKLRRLHSN